MKKIKRSKKGKDDSDVVNKERADKLSVSTEVPILTPFLCPLQTPLEPQGLEESFTVLRRKEGERSRESDSGRGVVGEGKRERGSGRGEEGEG